MGADHTAGLTIRLKIDHLDPKIQAGYSRTIQINMAGYDTLGACIFAGNGFAAAPNSISDLLNARYGWMSRQTSCRYSVVKPSSSSASSIAAPASPGPRPAA